MSTTRTGGFRRVALDHFEPEGVSDPIAQRKLRGHLEQIDYTAFAADKEIISATIGRVDTRDFQRIAVAAAQARARWVREAMTMSEGGHALRPEQAARLKDLRSVYEELGEAYEGLRRMVERGYVSYGPVDERRR